MWNFQCGENSGGEKVGVEYSWWGMFRVGNNRGGTFRGEFSGGEFAGHLKDMQSPQWESYNGL